MAPRQRCLIHFNTDTQSVLLCLLGEMGSCWDFLHPDDSGFPCLLRIFTRCFAQRCSLLMKSQEKEANKGSGVEQRTRLYWMYLYSLSLPFLLVISQSCVVSFFPIFMTFKTRSAHWNVSKSAIKAELHPITPPGP